MIRIQAGLNISRESFKKQAQFQGSQHLLADTSYISINNNNAEIELTWLNLTAASGLKKMIDIQENQGTFKLNQSYLNGDGARWGIAIDGGSAKKIEQGYFDLNNNIITTGDTDEYLYDDDYDDYEEGSDNAALIISQANNVNITRTILAFHEYQSPYTHQLRHLIRLREPRAVTLDSLYFTAEGAERDNDSILYIQGDSAENTNLVLNFRNNLDGTGFQDQVRTELSAIKGAWHDNQITSRRENIPSPAEFFSCLYHEKAASTTPSESEFSYSTHDTSILSTQTPAIQSTEQHSFDEWLPVNSDEQNISFSDMTDRIDSQNKNNLPTRYKDCPILDRFQEEKPEDDSQLLNGIGRSAAVLSGVVLVVVLVLVYVFPNKAPVKANSPPVSTPLMDTSV